MIIINLIPTVTPTLTIQTHKKELLTTGNVTPVPPPYQPPSKKNPALPNIEPWTFWMLCTATNFYDTVCFCLSSHSEHY